MEGLFWKTVNHAIFFGCIFATIGLSVYSISRFFQNEDITLVQSSTYHSSEERIYPSISLCLLPPFIENEFDKFDDYAINMSSYIQFLEGKIWDARMLEVDYDEVTVSLAKNLLGSYFVTQDNKKREWVPVYYTSFRSSKRKCFTIDAPYIDKELLYYFAMDINNDIFPNGRRSATNEISTYLHYPGQRLKSYYTLNFNWESRENKPKNYKMEFNINNINVISRRNKAQESCVKDWRNYDEFVMRTMMTKSGCHPPQWRETFAWNTSLDLPLCQNTSQMKIFAEQPTIAKIESLMPPCRSIDRLHYHYHEKENTKDYNLTNGHFHLTQIHIQPTFTERIQSRAYTIDDVVGAVGGYVGLFMGYALVQFPQTIMSVFAFIQKRKKCPAKCCQNELIKGQQMLPLMNN